MIPKPNQIYKHFKGNLYKIITLAVHTETEEQLVIYQALYGEFKVYARPLSMFMEKVDKKKYSDAAQTYRFELVEQMVQLTEEADEVSVDTVVCSQSEEKKETASQPVMEKKQIDPMLEAYLDTDSCRERLNILHGMHHKITEHILTTMAVVIDFELPQGDLETKYNALKDCLLTKEKYECSRML